MTSISITKVRANLYQTVSEVNESSQPITITNNRGKNADKDKKLLKSAGLEKKAKLLLDIIAEDPFKTPPLYESLVGNLSGFYSRRINIQHRLVYTVYAEQITENNVSYEGIVQVARMWTHYEGIK